MKYLPKHGIFFVHVPKCAGTSVQNALDLDDATYDVFAEDLGIAVAQAARLMHSKKNAGPPPPNRKRKGFAHPKLGPIHPSHLPLRFMCAEMPRTYEALFGAPYSFALVRSPRERFLSALMQHLKEFGGAGQIRADDPQVKAAALRICGWLEMRDGFCNAEYIHFARQTDFVDLDGERVVKAVFPMKQTGMVTEWLAENTGLRIEIPMTHVRRQPKRWARPVMPIARFAGQKLLPGSVKKALHPIWMSSRAFANAAGDYGGVDLGTDVEAFIAEYYAADADLHREALARFSGAGPDVGDRDVGSGEVA